MMELVLWKTPGWIDWAQETGEENNALLNPTLIFKGYSD